jgi:acetyl-CoA synthetase
MSATGGVWTPSPELVVAANVTRLGIRLGVPDGHIDGVRAVGRDDPERFWQAVVDDLGIEFLAPYERVRDLSGGAPFARWFTGGAVNLCHACVDRHVDAGAGDRLALVDEVEDGSVRRLTYAELQRETRRVAGGLLALGLAPGDRVAIVAPMTLEAMAAFLACARAGLVAVPLFSGATAAGALERVQASGARVLVAAASFVRRGKTIELGALARDVSTRAGIPLVVTGGGGGALAYEELDGDGAREPAALPSEHELIYAFTSGTTGRPKAAVHVHGGFLVKVAAEMAYGVDVRPGDRVSWYTELGWIQGPWLLVGGLVNGATVASYTGSVDVPDPARIWSFAERHELTALGVSPSLVRATAAAATPLVEQLGLESLRAICTAGEVLDESSYRWLLDTVLRGRAPVLNMSGGTEVAAMFLSSHPVETIVPGGFGGPALGCDMDVVGDDGESVRGEPGELVCRQPWPSMTRGFVGDRERYLASYWERHPGIWTHGDRALVDASGRWFLLGRSDDTLMIAGKRVSPSEYEDLLLGHAGVLEACAVGADDELKGEVAVCLVVPAAGAAGADEHALRRELLDLLVSQLGRMYAPARLQFVDELPRTRSNKIVRRTVRAIVAGEPVDASQLQDPAALDAVRAAR